MVFENAFAIMITLIHGDDLSASRNYYKSIQKKDSESFEGEKLTKEILEAALQSKGFFAQDIHITLENFLSKRKPSKELDSIIGLLNEHAKEADILIWESKQLTKKQISLFSNATVKEFSYPKSLFVLLDSLKPKNTKQLLTLYHQTLSHTEAEMILVMLTRQIRILLALTDESVEAIDEVARLAPWQKKKLLPQVQTFTLGKLHSLHTQLFQLDLESKTGGLSLPLSQSIDFFLSTI